ISSQGGELLRIRGLRFDSAGRINMLVNRRVDEPFDVTDFLARFSPSGTLDTASGRRGRLAPPLIPTPGNCGSDNSAIDPYDRVTFRLLLGPASHIALESSALFTQSGQSVTFTARPNLDGLTGTFEFLADGLSIAGCTSVSLVAGVAMCTTTALSPGARSIVA